MPRKQSKTQFYPRIDDESDPFYGYLDESRLVPHSHTIDVADLREIIKEAIRNANLKSSRKILNLGENTDEACIRKIFLTEGKKLFTYFVKYCGDPASTAFACQGRHYGEVAQEQFRNRTLQKERMNSGWRYQYIAKDGASQSQRFNTVSDLGASETDFCVSIREKGDSQKSVSIYVSVKNRSNTMGGQDWPKAIEALETVAQTDKNRTSPYICVFGIAMEKGKRLIKRSQKTGALHSQNTEIWKSDFFWPFFTNCTYEEIIVEVLRVLMEIGEKDDIGFEIPDALIQSFGQCCRDAALLDEQGIFHDPERLVRLFVGALPSSKKRRAK